ncbi:hypothetical protein KBB12_00385 [Candidatus Woesebacteria bacterium]|nr:hypothetical protein [Candidatus Woesebacteria bacterium]
METQTLKQFSLICCGRQSITGERPALTPAPGIKTGTVVVFCNPCMLGVQPKNIGDIGENPSPYSAILCKKLCPYNDDGTITPRAISVPSSWLESIE